MDFMSVFAFQAINNPLKNMCYRIYNWMCLNLLMTSLSHFICGLILFWIEDPDEIVSKIQRLNFRRDSN